MRWLPLAAVIGAQIGYPLTAGQARAGLVITTVTLGFLTSVGHAAATRGIRAAGVLLVVTTLGGLAVEATGLATGFPFGDYDYAVSGSGTTLGPALFGVPVIVPLAWTWMAWPAWLVAGHLTTRRWTRAALGGLALAAWDVFLDPQMVREGYWRWSMEGQLALPGVPAVPVSNHLGWLLVSVLMMALIAACAGERACWTRRRTDAPMLALYLWTYLSSILAHAVFLGLPASALWGGVAMGLVALPLSATLARPTRNGRRRTLAWPTRNGRRSTLAWPTGRGSLKHAHTHPTEREHPTEVGHP